MERSVPVEELTSGASSRIIPVFRNIRRSVPSPRSVLRIFVFFHAIFLWFLLVLRRSGRSPVCSKAAAAAASPLASPRRSGGGRGARKGWTAKKEEEEDVRRRRALAEELAMVHPSDGGDGGCRWETFVFLGSRRNALFCRLWVPSAGHMKGILVIIHGLNEHSGRYAHFAKQLTSCNFGLYAMDWIGHGGSDGLHGYVPSLDYVVEDTGIFLEKIRSENPGVPCFLFGHSTGGAVVLKAASYPRIEAMLEGIILTSPALRVKPAHPIVGAVAPIVSLLLPKYQFKGANRRGIPVSRDPAAMLAKYSDPLVYTGPIRVRTGHEILRMSSYLLQNLKSVTIPFLVLHGTADRVTDPLASQDLYNEAASVYKDIKLYEGFLHDLLFEPERDEIGTDIIDWMKKRLQQQCPQGLWHS
ncbi:monoacylglycerol lipase-like [Phoenix dactylifera]|uniref:Monoacylglycerol lipase-like n=1 Tax=Phoenix dactylifera TaxID=42345 RepID=A0A8B7C4H4_PHODC|nr:monoacylglycerol lipase-like [Phoenix dactylifera]